MPDIDGTGSADDIDVTSDVGTLNGSPAGTPIDNIRGRGGGDTITVTDSTISGRLAANGGSDVVTVQNSAFGDIRLGSGDDTIDFVNSSISGNIRGNSGTDALNLPEGTVVNDSSFGTFTVVLGASYSLSGGTFTLPSGQTVTYTTFESGTGIPCFTRNTRIRTDMGSSRIQDLRVGDLVPTRDNGLSAIRWIGSRKLTAADMNANPKLRPVRIMKGALGDGFPNRDLIVSRQHRMLVCSKVAEHMFGCSEVLIPAIKLTALPGVFVDEDLDSVEYFHILFAEHEIIEAEGAPSESLYIGREALKAVSPEARDEIFSIFPDLANPDFAPRPARIIPPLQQQKSLVRRHLKNRNPMVAGIGR